MVKICTKCKIEKPVEEFWKESANKDGLRNQCKNVCGLHVPWNLAVIPTKENRSKNNKFFSELGLAPTLSNGLLKNKE